MADIVRAHGEELRRAQPLSSEQRAVLHAILRCRTSELGGHLDVCLACGHAEPAYNSCRNRHCPKCQALAQARWVARRSERILPTHYFHVVFTLPAELRPLAQRNPRRIYDLLFATASETLLDLGRDEKWLGAELGITAVLHTWTRELAFHPHVHCIVTGGGLTADGAAWRSSPPDFLFPVRVLGALVRGKMLDALGRAHRRQPFDLGGAGADPQAFEQLLAALRRRSWVVYAKRPFGGAAQVVRYLGQYTHRIGISNHRLVSFRNGEVTFRTKNGEHRTMAAKDFLARFVQHVLPPGFVKLRHYGLMSPSHATTRLEDARRILDADGATHECDEAAPNADATARVAAHATWPELLLALTGVDVKRCPSCGQAAIVRRPLVAAEARAPPEAAT
jgi:predicted RNA-binding Zn-ribbon protein involved in translation (DUF1610 family)